MAEILIDPSTGKPFPSFYHSRRILSHNALFNAVVGGRSNGKSFEAKRWAIKDFKNKENQFIYLRRNDSEIKPKEMRQFFNDIQMKFPGDEMDYRDGAFFINGNLAGWPMALSTARTIRSVPYNGVNKIIFDEFIKDNSRFTQYLPNEPIAFQEFYSTVARDRNVRVMFIANALELYNPYFVYWDLFPGEPGSIVRSKNGAVAIENYYNEQHNAYLRAQDNYKLIEGTVYEEYAIENKFTNNRSDFIERKGSTAEYSFTMVFNGERYGIWSDYIKGLYYVSQNVDPTCKLIYAFTLEDHSPNTMLLKGKASAVVDNFKKAFKYGQVRFENLRVESFMRQFLRSVL